MAPAATHRVIAKKGKKLSIRPRKASGFDYPTQLVGTSQWKGSDGKPVTVYFDPSTGTEGKTVAEYVLSKIDDVMKSCDAWFGVQGMGGNVVVAPDFGGAYHYGCDFQSGGDWYLSLSQQDTTVGLAVAEITESYMGLQGKGWNCGGSGGEALSRVLAEIATGGANGAMKDYSAGPSWDGVNWIDKDSGTDQDYPSTGCGVLYLWWMFGQGYSPNEIVQAGESGGTLAGNYRTLTGKATAWTDFKAAVQNVGGPGSFDTDNPFNSPDPDYPAGGSPPPPPPPPPGGPGTLAATGTLDFFGQSLPIQLAGTFQAGSAAEKTNINVWAVLGDLAAIYSAAKTGDWAAAAIAFEQLLADAGFVSSDEQKMAMWKALLARAETAPLTSGKSAKPE